MSALPDNIRSRIESLGIPFELKGTVKTSMNHIERETWILEYEGSQFVYVAGQKNVTLGWDTHQCPLGDGVLHDLREYFEQGQEYYQDQMDDTPYLFGANHYHEFWLPKPRRGEYP